MHIRISRLSNCWSVFHLKAICCLFEICRPTVCVIESSMIHRIQRKIIQNGPIAMSSEEKSDDDVLINFAVYIRNASGLDLKTVVSPYCSAQTHSARSACSVSTMGHTVCGSTADPNIWCIVSQTFHSTETANGFIRRLVRCTKIYIKLHKNGKLNTISKEETALIGTHEPIQTDRLIDGMKWK